jgi:hypothetical protein
VRLVTGGARPRCVGLRDANMLRRRRRLDLAFGAPARAQVPITVTGTVI